MDLSRPVARVFLRLAAIPVAIFLFVLIPVLKDCIAKVRTPCAKMVEEDEVQQLTGIRVNEVSVVDRDDYCNADHWDYFRRRLMMVAVQKNGTGMYGASFASQLQSLKLGRGVVATDIWRTVPSLIRPLMKQVMPPPEEKEEESAAGEREEGEGAEGEEGEGEDDSEVELSPEAAARLAYEEKLARVRDLARSNPRVVANLIKEWMGVNEQR